MPSQKRNFPCFSLERIILDRMSMMFCSTDASSFISKTLASSFSSFFQHIRICPFFQCFSFLFCPFFQHVSSLFCPFSQYFSSLFSPFSQYFSSLFSPFSQCFSLYFVRFSKKSAHHKKSNPQTLDFLNLTAGGYFNFRQTDFSLFFPNIAAVDALLCLV